MIAEALLVHYADDVDAKFFQLAAETSAAKPYSRVMAR